MNMHNSITIDPILKMIYHYLLFNTKNTILANNLYGTNISSTLLYIAGDTGTELCYCSPAFLPLPFLHCITFTDGQCITLGSKRVLWTKPQDVTVSCALVTQPVGVGGWRMAIYSGSTFRP